MNTTQTVNTLWQQFRKAINDSYAVGQRSHDEDLACLRDYAEDISWTDDLSALLGREAANERQHRRNRPSPKGFSVDTAAKLCLMSNAARGAFKTAMPKATAFLELRQTAVEAEVLGFLCRHALTREWCKAVDSLDYAKLMQVAA